MECAWYLNDTMSGDFYINAWSLMGNAFDEISTTLTAVLIDIKGRMGWP